MKKNLSKSRQGIPVNKTWRYDSEMQFVGPFLRIRGTNGNFVEMQSTEGEIKNEEATATDEQSIVENNIQAANDEFSGGTSDIKANAIKDFEAALAVVMKYLAKRQELEDGRAAPKDLLDLFFQTVAEKIRAFTPYYKNLAQSKIFALVQDMELEQLWQPADLQPVIDYLSTAQPSVNQTSDTPPPSTSSTPLSTFIQNYNDV